MVKLAYCTHLSWLLKSGSSAASVGKMAVPMREEWMVLSIHGSAELTQSSGAPWYPALSDDDIALPCRTTSVAATAEMEP